jgi:ankyrin repeat protein
MFSPAGKSALHWAAAVNNVEATLLLLKNGANRDMQDNKVQPGISELEDACSSVSAMRPFPLLCLLLR